MTRDQKLEINVDLFQALTSVLEASPTEATPVVVLSAYLHSLAKEYGLSDSQNLTGEHLNSFRPPPRITPWLSDMLGGELEPEFLRNRVYRAIVELAQNSEARRLINRRGHLSETGALMLAQVHWNIERTETRPLLPIQSAQAITGKSAQIADIKANAHEDFATMQLTRRSNIGVIGLGDGQASQSSGQGFRTLGARIAVLAAQAIATPGSPRPAGELRVTALESGKRNAVIWWEEAEVRVALSPAADLSQSILPQLDALFLDGAWSDARPLNDFMIGHLEEQSIADFGVADRELAREYLRRSIMFRARGDVKGADEAGDKAYELFRALVEVEGDDPDPDLLKEFAGSSIAKLTWDHGPLIQRMSLWRELLELREGRTIAELPNGFVLLLTASDLAVAVGKDIEQRPHPGDSELRARVSNGELDELREEVDDFLDRVQGIFDQVPDSGDVLSFRSSHASLAEVGPHAAAIVERDANQMAQLESEVAVAILLVSAGEVRYARNADLDEFLGVLGAAAETAQRLTPSLARVPDILAWILRSMRGRLALLLTESGRADEALDVLSKGVQALQSKDTFDAAEVKELVDYAAVALIADRPDLALAWTETVAERRDEDAESDATNHFAPAIAHFLAYGALIQLGRVPDGIARLSAGVDLQAGLADEIPPLLRPFIPAPITSTVLREIAESLAVAEEPGASRSVLRLAEQVDP